MKTNRPIDTTVYLLHVVVQTLLSSYSTVRPKNIPFSWSEFSSVIKLLCNDKILEAAQLWNQQIEWITMKL